jgi:hypothetical protein
VEEVVVDRYREDEVSDWRTWNLSRSRAGHLAETYAGPGKIPAASREERDREGNSM